MALYANDTSADVRNLVRDLVRLPWSSKQILTAILERCPSTGDDSADDYPDAWLAVADQLHDYGLLDGEVRERALLIISSGLDIDLKRRLGSTERDAKVRATILQELALKLAQPSPKPKPRRVLKAPDPMLFQPGTILRYPTHQGAPVNPWVAPAVIARDFKADGWGTAIVLTAGHADGFVAWYAIGRLGEHGRESPSVQDCLASGIENEPNWANESGKGTLAVARGAMAPMTARKLNLETLGTFEIDQDRLTEHVPRLAPSPDQRYTPLDTLVLQWRSKDVVRLEGEFDLPPPRVALPLSDLTRRA